jgi:hypothetical protein
MNHFPDPDVQHGHLRVLPVTSGGYVVIDERRPVGKKTVMHFKKLAEAAHACLVWYQQGHG